MRPTACTCSPATAASAPRPARPGPLTTTSRMKRFTLEVGSVILAPGFKPFDPSNLPAYGYGRYPNVYTSLEFERILSPGGPYHGHVVRRSDGKEPKKIAWIHCVGMRSDREGEHPYCSNFCCMVALKQAVIAREHIGQELDMALFYMDMRTPRKDFEKYMVRIQNQGARLIRSRVHTVSPAGEGGDLEVRYVTEAGEVLDEIFDAVVLSVGMVTPPDVVTLAEKLEVPLSPNNFVEASCFEPTSTFREGIFSCGAFNGPKDIPQSVMEGSAAAAASTRYLAEARGTLARKKEFPPEQDVLAEPVRVGVFVCNCGLNIGGVADVPDIVAYAHDIPDVAYAQENLFTCSQDAQAVMVEKIKEHNLNRVVVAACSPSTHAPIFQDMLRTAGLNKYLFEMANIRNQCTWVHLNEPDMATDKCKGLVNMAVAKARLLQPLDYITVSVNRRALVIGGGVAGMTSALALADQGYVVDLVERKDRLGGNALKLHTTWRGGLVKPRLDALIRKVTGHDQITIHYNARVEGVSGVVGNFTSTLSTGAAIEHGVVVIAIGAEPLRPEGMYLYKQNPNVLLSLDLDREIMENRERLKTAQAAAFILCVGSRTPERPYCNKVCCAHSVESAIKLKTINPEMDVYILYRDMRTYGEREALYQRARELGVMFIRHRLAGPAPGGRGGRPPEDHGHGSDHAEAGDFHGGLSDPGHHHHSPSERAPGGTLQGALERRGFFRRGPRQDQAGGGRNRRHLYGGAVPLSQAHAGVGSRGPGLRLPGQHHLVQGYVAAGVHHQQPHRRELRRLRLLRGRLPVPGHHAPGIHAKRQPQKDRGSQPHPVQGVRLLYGHLPQGGHLRGRVHPGTAGSPGGRGYRVDLGEIA